MGYWPLFLITSIVLLAAGGSLLLVAGFSISEKTRAAGASCLAVGVLLLLAFDLLLLSPAWKRKLRGDAMDDDLLAPILVHAYGPAAGALYPAQPHLLSISCEACDQHPIDEAEPSVFCMHCGRLRGGASDACNRQYSPELLRFQTQLQEQHVRIKGQEVALNRARECSQFLQCHEIQQGIVLLREQLERTHGLAEEQARMEAAEHARQDAAGAGEVWDNVQSALWALSSLTESEETSACNRQCSPELLRFQTQLQEQHARIKGQEAALNRARECSQFLQCHEIQQGIVLLREQLERTHGLAEEQARMEAAEAEKAMVCEFDPENGFALNDAARAHCVARWMQDSIDDFGDIATVRVDFKVLRQVTNNFDKRHLLGEGGSCRVFKGDVYDYPTAIKMFNETDGAWDDRQIEAEIEILCRIRHPHISKLLAVSFNGPHRCLIIEYMNGGALDTRLTNKALPVLQWRDRAHILLHVARGLVYMHSLNPPVTHRDVKCANVLLQYTDGAGSETLLAKVSDFGEHSL
jgi:hypothetical protein